MPTDRPPIVDRRDLGRRFEVTVFVKDVVGREKRFVEFANRRSRAEERGGIVKWLAGARD